MRIAVTGGWAPVTSFASGARLYLNWLTVQSPIGSIA